MRLFHRHVAYGSVRVDVHNQDHRHARRDVIAQGRLRVFSPTVGGEMRGVTPAEGDKSSCPCADPLAMRMPHATLTREIFVVVVTSERERGVGAPLPARAAKKVIHFRRPETDAPGASVPTLPLRGMDLAPKPASRSPKAKKTISATGMARGIS
ncbi:MAG: hypothetical protein M3O50_09415 [Myxococcota bacterium]|nr:hypothetical protein [Myxococcota bacterium]